MHYAFELAWILPSVAVPVAILVAITLTAFAVGIRVPDVAGRVDPKALSRTPPFDQPGVKELAPGRYEVAMIAQVFAFTPGEIRVKAGSEVTFEMTSRDVIHGVKISNSPVNVMVVPGQISRVTAKFDKPGEYLILCHEYCGSGHHVMAGRLIVE
ncbi:MAG: cytochrome c oxidase subunit II [Chloroflexaceae bacterium]|nr:cytochrome c oxidase subunit II [Chloroflexaceae bacterium]